MSNSVTYQVCRAADEFTSAEDGYKHGYSLFAALDGYPVGFSEYFLKKKLV